MFRIDIMSRKPIYEQISEQAEAMIMTNLLKPGDKMPSVRSLSIELSVNPNTIQRAYNELCAKGIIFSVTGKGCFVCNDAADVISRFAFEKIKSLKSIITELKLAGIQKQQVISTVEQIYSQGGNTND